MNGDSIGDMSFGQTCPSEDTKQRRMPMPSATPARVAGPPERLSGRRKVELI